MPSPCLSEDSDNSFTVSEESQEEKKRILEMILCILFPKMSLMILFVILVCRSHQLSSWHPDWRKKAFCLMAQATLFIATGIKNSFISFLKKKVWFNAQAIFIFYKKLGVPHYEPQDWRLFIDSCKISLKCVLLHNGYQLASVPLAHSTSLGWRTMIQWSMCWRKYLTVSTSGRYVLTLK